MKLGARKLGVLSVPPLGCMPIARVFNKSEDYGCITRLNGFTEKFERALEGMLQGLSSEFTDLKYSLGKSYEITIRMMDDPTRFGKLLSLMAHPNNILHTGKLSLLASDLILNTFSGDPLPYILLSLSVSCVFTSCIPTISDQDLLPYFKYVTLPYFHVDSSIEVIDGSDRKLKKMKKNV